MGFPVPKKDGTQKCTRKPLADTNRKERPLSSSVLGGEGKGVYAMRPYVFDRKKEPSFGFPAPEKDGIQKCTRKPLADTNRKERPFGFPVLGGEGEGAYAIRPYLAGRKKEPSLGFPALGGEDYGAYAIRPYPFDRKKD